MKFTSDEGFSRKSFLFRSHTKKVQNLVFPHIHNLRLVSHNCCIFPHGEHSRVHELNNSQKKIIKSCDWTYALVVLAHNLGSDDLFILEQSFERRREESYLFSVSLSTGQTGMHLYLHTNHPHNDQSQHPICRRGRHPQERMRRGIQAKQSHLQLAREPHVHLLHTRHFACQGLGRHSFQAEQEPPK
jgi:hypothetical protein